MLRLLKMFSRILHMLSTTVLSGTIILTYLIDLGSHIKDHHTYTSLHAWSGIILIASGILNIFLIKAGK